jgi:hypothetical protein
MRILKLVDILWITVKRSAMPDQGFFISFIHAGIAYSGLIQPYISAHQTVYRVDIENLEQRVRLAVILKPSPFNPDEWEFKWSDGSREAYHCDDELLLEIGKRARALLLRAGQWQDSPSLFN